MTKDSERSAGGQFAVAPWLGVGDDVSVERWDKTERPEKRIGSPAKVTKIEREWSETGIMVTVIGSSGNTLRVDMNWLHPYTPNAGTQRPGTQDAPPATATLKPGSLK